jgi:hypothetical protein
MSGLPPEEEVRLSPPIEAICQYFQSPLSKRSLRLEVGTSDADTARERKQLDPMELLSYI